MPNCIPRGIYPESRANQSLDFDGFKELKNLGYLRQVKLPPGLFVQRAGFQAWYSLFGEHAVDENYRYREHKEMHMNFATLALLPLELCPLFNRHAKGAGQVDDVALFFSVKNCSPVLQFSSTFMFL
jgi:hypothetical protein